MKNQSRGQRGKKLTKYTYGGSTYQRVMRAGNPLKTDKKGKSKAEVSLNGASLFVGFKVNF